jgi:hypothetical protein
MGRTNTDGVSNRHGTAALEAIRTECKLNVSVVPLERDKLGAVELRHSKEMDDAQRDVVRGRRIDQHDEPPMKKENKQNVQTL